MRFYVESCGGEVYRDISKLVISLLPTIPSFLRCKIRLSSILKKSLASALISILEVQGKVFEAHLQQY